MRRFNVAVGALALLSLLGTRPAGSQVARTSAEMRTPLHLLGPGAMFVVSAVETRTTAQPIEIQVRFFDDADRLVKQVEGEFGPARPLIVSLRRAELRSRDTFAPVRAVVNVSGTGGFGGNQAAVRFELVLKGGGGGCGGGCFTCPREINGLPVACLPGGGGNPDVNIYCPDGAAFLSAYTVE
jgi:hypothetical protein